MISFNHIYISLLDHSAMQNQPLPCLCDNFDNLHRPDLKRIHSGLTDDDRLFQSHYGLQIPDINLECMRCCLFYLRRRNYSVYVGGNDFVLFPEMNLVPGEQIFVPPITAFINIPGGGGMRGQIATGYDINIGIPIPSARSFANSRTYQMYTPTEVLSVGFVGHSRMESIAIDVVNRYELKDIKVNYAHAALIELYRIKVGKHTLSGCCSHR